MLKGRCMPQALLSAARPHAQGLRAVNRLVSPVGSRHADEDNFRPSLKSASNPKLTRNRSFPMPIQVLSHPLA